MIALTISMLRSRWAQALTVLALAMLATAAAVAAPVYVDMATRAVIADDIAAAPVSQRTLTAFDVVQVKAEPGSVASQQLVVEASRRDFEHTAPPALRTPGFATSFAVGYPVSVTAATAQPGRGEHNGSLEFRQDGCEHVAVVAGRCPGAPGEVMVSVARSSALPVGATAVVTALRFVGAAPGEPGVWIPDGAPCRLAVVGVYRGIDTAAAYWGRSGPQMRSPGSEPVLATRRTVASCDHKQESAEVVAYALPGTFDAGNLDAVRASVRSTLDRSPSELGVSTGIEDLLNAIDRDRKAVAAVPTGAALPLVALCWFVLFLAIAHTASARRRELAVVKLRGVSTADQWWLAAAESLTPVLVGSAAGYLLGHIGVFIYGRFVFGPVADVALNPRAWGYAVAALGGAIVAAVVALRRDLASTPTDLLRRVPSRGTAWAGLTLAVIVGAVAAVAVAQLRGQAASNPDPGGLAPLAPALALTALGLLCGAAVEPAAARIGGWALRRGRVGLAVGALQLGRTRNGSRLLALAVVAVSLLTFASAAAEVSADTRRRQVELALGADRVLSVSQVRAATLLRAVRAADPAGEYAMAVVYPDNGADPRRPLALDATRLANTAIWPDAGGLTAAGAASALRPPVTAPVVVRGGGLAVAVTVAALELRTTPASLHLQVVVVPEDGSASLTYELGELRTGSHVYATPVSCASGCRVGALVVSPRGAVDGEFRLTVESIRQSDPDAPLVAPSQLASWISRDPAALRAQPSPEGMQISARSSLFGAAGLRIVAPDAPVPLPMLDAGSTNLLTLRLADGQRITNVTVATPMALPRLGASGALVDLEYLIRSGEIGVASRSGEIWLGPAAPADAAARFAAAGLTITGERSLSRELAAAARRPSAAGVRFLLVVAVLGLVLGVAGLGVAAGVERRGRTEEMRSLRAQGMSRRDLRRSALVGYVGVVGLAIALGWLSAAAVWSLTGDRMPLVDRMPLAEGGPSLAIPDLPGAGALAAWAIGAAVLVLLALALSAALTRAGEDGGRR